jgi:hypothetical protein
MVRRQGRRPSQVQHCLCLHGRRQGGAQADWMQCPDLMWQQLCRWPFKKNCSNDLLSVIVGKPAAFAKCYTQEIKLTRGRLHHLDVKLLFFAEYCILSHGKGFTQCPRKYNRQRNFAEVDFAHNALLSFFFGFCRVSLIHGKDYFFLK